MPWFKIDDNLAFHPKVINAGNAAMGLWARAGAWASHQMTDGFVPASIAATLGTAPQAEKLVRAGLWDRVDGGFSFHEWAERNPKRDAIESERAAARERMQSRRRTKKGQFSESPQVSESGSGEHFRTPSEVFAHPDPTRPDPTVLKNSGSTRAARLPASWAPTDEHRTRARESGVDVEREVVKFRAYNDEKGRTAKNWNAAFTRWLMNAAEYAERDGRGPSKPQGSTFWDRGPV